MKTKHNMCLVTPKGLNLRYAVAKDYLDSIDTQTLNKGLKNKIINLCVFVPFYFWIFIILFILMGLVVSYIMSNNVNASDEKYYYIETIATPLPAFISCKEHKAKNTNHCLKTGLAIAYAESTWQVKNNYFWLTSKDKSINSWTSRYVKYWYPAKNWGRFYWYNENRPAETRYCVSEESSWSVGWCKNWRKNFDYIFFNKELNNFINK